MEITYLVPVVKTCARLAHMLPYCQLLVFCFFLCCVRLRCQQQCNFITDSQKRIVSEATSYVAIDPSTASVIPGGP